jgi:hypothetical protein
MKKLFLLVFAFSFLLSPLCFAQEEVNDEAMRYQSQRMVFQQWNQNDFKPGKGFLDTNPYYWLVWGFFDPNYHKTDLRPLSASGPQTQRIALVAGMSSTDKKYKLQSDTVRNTALSQIAENSGVFSGADPMWLLYYKSELNPVLNYNPVSILAGFSPQASASLVSSGLYSWYTGELARLKQRAEAAHSTDMDRGSRILAYYRLLKDYRVLAGVWSTRAAAVQQTINLTAQQQKVITRQVPITDWTPHTDIDIANKVLLHVQ